MLRLVAVSTVLVCACYAPATPDCALTCAVDTDCTSAQVCTGTHLCAATRDTACNGLVTDGAMLDSGPLTVQVQVVITGGGSVQSSAGAECTSGTCSYHVVENTDVTLVAVDHGNNTFDAWTTSPCASQGRMCQFTASAATTAAVSFSHDH